MPSLIDQLAATGGSARPVSAGPANVRKAQSNLNKSASKARSLARSKGNKSLIDELDKIAQGKSEGGSGFSLNPLDLAGEAVGALGTGISKVLEVADVPRSYAASTVNQVANSLDDVAHGDGVGFDLGTLYQDAKAHKGIGNYLQEQLVKEANRGDGRHADIFGIPIDVKDPNAAQMWLQRGLGLTGDIATDPLTYIGTGLVDEAGRVGAGGLEHLGRAKAAEVLAAGGKLTDEEIARVGRFGLTGVAPERAAQLGINPTMTLAGFPIRGTEGVARGLRTAVGVTKAGLGDGVLGEGIRRLRTPTAERALQEAVVGGGEHAADAARALAANASERALGRTFGEVERQGLHDVLSQAKKSGAKSEDILKALEESPAHLPPEAQPIADWLSGVRERALAQGADVKEIAGYAPHQMTNKARRILARSGDVPLKAGEQKFGPELLRDFKVGDEFMGKTLERGSLDEMNEIFQKAKGVPLFETDINRILPKYLAGVQGIVGKAAGGKRLTELGVGRDVGSEIVNAAQTGNIGSVDVIAELSDRLKNVKLEGAKAKVEQAAAHGAAADVAERALRSIPADAQPALVHEAAQSVAKLAPVVDPVSVAAHAATTNETVASQVAATHSAIDAVLATKPKDAANYVAMRDWMDSVDEILTHYGMDADPNVRLAANLWAQGETAATKATLAKQTQMSTERLLAKLKTPTYQTAVADVIDDGFKKIAGTRFAQPEWLAEAAETSKRIRQPGQWQSFLDAYDWYTQLWKGYATLSPGFHFRNAYGGVLNNWIAKVDSKGVYGDFHDLWQAAKKGKFTPEQRAEWDFVQAATAGTGGGLFANELETSITGKGRFNPASKNFGLFQKSQQAGNFVEGHLRGTMALDSLRKGQGLEETVARIEKFHFNYADISDFDRAAKRIIPFWMFTSRNLPLQVEMMLRRPGIYTKYAALKRNMELGTTPEDIVPGYFDEAGAIHTDLTLPGAEGDAYFSPDLPFLRLTSDADKFDDPARAISDMNPLVKLPLELLAGKKLYNDQPFKKDPQELPGSWGPINNLLEAIGLAERGGDGKLYASDQTSYGVENLVPALGRVRRLAPTEDVYKQRWGSSVTGFLGGPFKVNTPSAQAGELANRQSLIDALVAHERAVGNLPKTKAQARRDRAG